MMKRICALILGLSAIVCLTGCSLLLFTDTPVTQANRDRIREEIYTYVTQNESELAAALPALLAMPETVRFIEPDENGTVLAHERVLFDTVRPVTDEAICALFAGPVESITPGEAIEFFMGGMGNVTNSVYTGFYYSPQDIPLWISAKDEYLYYPMIEYDEGWIADKSLCADDAGMKHYQLYTEKIMDCWYYYELKL